LCDDKGSDRRTGILLPRRLIGTKLRGRMLAAFFIGHEISPAMFEHACRLGRGGAAS
jgi:hypothetical protein